VVVAPRTIPGGSHHYDVVGRSLSWVWHGGRFPWCRRDRRTAVVIAHVAVALAPLRSGL